MNEYAKIAFANGRDYIPRDGREFDVHDLDADQTAAIAQIDFEDVVDRRTGEVRRRTRVRLHDKVAALNGIAKCLGMTTERHVLEGSVEHIIRQMTPQERAERVRESRRKAELVYLPRYRAMLGAEGRTLDAEPEDGAAADEIEGEAVADDPGQVDGAGAAPTAACPEETVEAMRQRVGNGLGGEIDDLPERAAWDRDRR